MNTIVVCVVPDPPKRKPPESPGVAAAVERARQFAAEYLDGRSQAKRLGVLAGLCIQRVLDTNCKPWNGVFGDEWQTFHWIAASKLPDLLAYLGKASPIQMFSFGVNVVSSIQFGPLESLAADDLLRMRGEIESCSR